MSLALASAIMEGAIRGGASRQVAAAVASALFRSGESKGEAVLIDVPDVVADDIPVVAASMATQRVAGAVFGQEFRDSGRAYEAIRKVLPRDLARDVRQVNRAANKARHRSSWGGKANVDGSWVANKMSKQKSEFDDCMGDWVYGTHGSQYKISVLNGDISFTEGSRTGTLLAAGDALEGQINNTDGTLHGYIQISSTTAFGEPCPVSRFRKSPDVDWDLPLLASRSRTPNPKSSRTPP